MKLVVERDALNTAINTVYRTSRGVGDNPLLRNILLTPAGGTLGIAATNMNMRADATIPAEVDRAPALTVQGEALAQIVATLPQGSQVTMAWVDENFVTVQCAGSRYRLLALPPMNFPTFEQKEEATDFTMRGEDLAGALSAVQNFISRDETRLFLTGVCIQKENRRHEAFGNSTQDRLSFVSTTRFEFGRVVLSLPESADGMPQIIVPRAAVEEIIRQCDDVKDDVLLSVSSRLIRVTTRRHSFVSKLIDATFPDFYNGFPAQNTNRARVDTKNLMSALSRITSIGDLRRTQIVVGPGQFCITAIGKNGAEAEEIVEIDYEGQEAEINLGISAKSMLSVLGSIDSDICEIRMGDAKQPILLNPVKKGEIDYDRTYLTMQLDE